MPFFSICIPTYESEILLKRAINSIVAQTYKDWEIVISDDSSSDLISELVKKYNVPIRYYRNEKALRNPRNWTNAINYAEGEVVLLLHQDDFFISQDSLERIAVSIQSQHSDILFTQCRWFSDKTSLQVIRGITGDSFELLKKGSLTELFECNYLSVPSVCFFKKSLDISYDDNLIYLVDVDFYMQALLLEKINVGAHFFPEIGVRIDSADQVTNTLATKELRKKEWEYFYKKWSLKLPNINFKIALENALKREGIEC